MIWDGQALFSSLSGQSITTTAISSNSIDLGAGIDMAVLDGEAPIILAHCLTSFASATPTAGPVTMTIAAHGIGQ